MWRAFACLLILFGGTMKVYAQPAADEILKVEALWSHALATNDVPAMNEFAAEDWMIIGAEGTVTTKATFLAVVKSGDLVHDQMTLDIETVRIYGETAIATGIARSGGTWKGHRFATHERSTDVFVKIGGRWLCVFTQLTALPEKPLP